MRGVIYIGFPLFFYLGEDVEGTPTKTTVFFFWGGMTAEF